MTLRRLPQKVLANNLLFSTPIKNNNFLIILFFQAIEALASLFSILF